jgi:capsular exopolysaccharide synthesis family protein
MSRISDALARASGGALGEPGTHTGSTGAEVLAGVETFATSAPAERHEQEDIQHAPLHAAAGSDAAEGMRAAAPLPDPLPPDRHLLEALDADAAEKLVVGEMAASSLEHYRRLAAVLHQTHLTTGLRVVMIASAIAGEGKTLTSANLALTLSESYRRRVLLIDADLRRPSIHTLFGLENLDGLTDVLKSAGERKVSTRAVSATLSVVTAGRPDSEQMAHLTSDRMRRLLKEAVEVYDWVIIDTPPVALLSDAKLLAAMVDGAVLVVRAGSTPYTIVQRAIQAIGPERILGTVLNGAEASAVAGHSYYDGYYSYPRASRRRWWQRRGRDGDQPATLGRLTSE